MTKTTTYKGMKIVPYIEDGTREERYYIFTKEEYSYGKGYRTPETDVGCIEEAHEFIDCYELF